MDLKKKKTPFVWIILVIACWLFLGSLSQLISIFLTEGTELFPESGENATEWEKVLVIMISIFRIITPIVLAFFIYKLLSMPSDIVKWTHIIFALYLFLQLPTGAVVMLFSLHVISEPLGFLALAPSFLMLVAYVVVWIFFVKHLKHAKENKLMEFA